MFVFGTGKRKLKSTCVSCEAKIKPILDVICPASICNEPCDATELKRGLPGFFLAIIGGMKAGKSTVINAIVGHQVEPWRTVPMTLLPTVITHTPGQRTPKLLLRPSIVDALNEAVQELAIVLQRNEDCFKFPVGVGTTKATVKRCDLLFKQEYTGDEVRNALEWLNDLCRIWVIVSECKEFEFKARTHLLTEFLKEGVQNLPRVEVEFVGFVISGVKVLGTFSLVDTPSSQEARFPLTRDIIRTTLGAVHNVIHVLNCTSFGSEGQEEMSKQLEEFAYLRPHILMTYWDVAVKQKRQPSTLQEEIRNFLLSSTGLDLDPSRIHFTALVDAVYVIRFKKYLKEKDAMPPFDHPDFNLLDDIKCMYGYKANEAKYKELDRSGLDYFLQSRWEESGVQAVLNQLSLEASNSFITSLCTSMKSLIELRHAALSQNLQNLTSDKRGEAIDNELVKKFLANDLEKIEKHIQDLEAGFANDASWNSDILAHLKTIRVERKQQADERKQREEDERKREERRKEEVERKQREKDARKQEEFSRRQREEKTRTRRNDGHVHHVADRIHSLFKHISDIYPPELDIFPGRRKLVASSNQGLLAMLQNCSEQCEGLDQLLETNLTPPMLDPDALRTVETLTEANQTISVVVNQHTVQSLEIKQVDDEKLDKMKILQQQLKQLTVTRNMLIQTLNNDQDRFNAHHQACISQVDRWQDSIGHCETALSKITRLVDMNQHDTDDALTSTSSSSSSSWRDIPQVTNALLTQFQKHLPSILDKWSNWRALKLEQVQMSSTILTSAISPADLDLKQVESMKMVAARVKISTEELNTALTEGEHLYQCAQAQLKPLLKCAHRKWKANVDRAKAHVSGLADRLQLISGILKHQSQVLSEFKQVMENNDTTSLVEDYEEQQEEIDDLVKDMEKISAKQTSAISKGRAERAAKLDLKLNKVKSDINRQRQELVPLGRKLMYLSRFFPEMLLHIPELNPLHGTIAQGLPVITYCELDDLKPFQSQVGRNTLYLGRCSNLSNALKTHQVSQSQFSTSPWYIFKEFTHMGSKGDGTSRSRHELRRTASVMASLGQHPNIISMNGLCRSESGSWLLIRPYLPRGHLRQVWSSYSDAKHSSLSPQSSSSSLSTTMALSSSERRRHAALKYLRGILEGLHALHSAGFIHRDLKPENILINNEDVPMIIDFETAKLTELANAQRSIGMTPTVTMAAAAGSLGYQDPALLKAAMRGQSLRPSPHIDMYAFGVIMGELLFARKFHDPSDVKQFQREHLNRDQDQEDELLQSCVNILSQLLENDAYQKRPSAESLLAHPCFQNPLSQVMRQCCICWGTYHILDGLECKNARNAYGGPHFICKDCFSSHIQDQCQHDNMQQFQDNQCRIFCPKQDEGGHDDGGDGDTFDAKCSSPPFSVATIALHASPQVFTQFQSFLLKVQEAKLAVEMEKESKKRIDAEVKRLREMDARQRKIQQAHSHVMDKILLPRCPGCDSPMDVGFDACFAVTCANDCHFCAWCLLVCTDENSAHSHVPICPVARAMGYGGKLFAPKELYDETHRRRRAKEVQEYLLGLAPEDPTLRVDVLDKCRQHLEDLDIYIDFN